MLNYRIQNFRRQLAHSGSCPTNAGESSPFSPLPSRPGEYPTRSTACCRLRTATFLFSPSLRALHPANGRCLWPTLPGTHQPPTSDWRSRHAASLVLAASCRSGPPPDKRPELAPSRKAPCRSRPGRHGPCRRNDVRGLEHHCIQTLTTLSTCELMTAVPMRGRHATVDSGRAAWRPFCLSYGASLQYRRALPNRPEKSRAHED
mgnify:CR=1 FL=1